MIKSFIYLDEQKMYSLSSQIFEGITEYILREGEEGTETTEEQRGPVGSGRVLADAIKKSSKSTERKFIHDYAFTVFEKSLAQEGRVVELSAPCEGLSQSDIFGLVKTSSLVKIKARATFHDFGKMAGMFSDFNKIGHSISYLGAYEQLQQSEAQYEEIKKTLTTKEQRRKLDETYKEAKDISKIAKESGMHFDQAFLDSMAFITRQGFQDQFEISQNLQGVTFSSCLKRELLRDNTDLLIKKYSRHTEKEVVILGLISQSLPKQLENIDDPENHTSMRAALSVLTEKLAILEHTLSGKQDSEVVIDPIAAYFEV